MAAFTRDSRGVAEFTGVEPANAFSTLTTSYVDTATAAKLAGTLASYRYCITDVILTAQTTTTITLLEDTTTSKMVYKFGASGGEQQFHFGVPIMFATGTAIHLTMDATGSTVYIGGYYRS